MKILFYNPAHISYSSGPETWLIYALPILADAGYEITLVTTDFQIREDGRDYIKYFERHGIRYIVLNSVKLPFSGSPIPKSLSKIVGKVDITYGIYGYAFQDIIGLLIAKKTRSKIVYGCHSPSEYLSGIQKLYYDLVTKSLLKHAPGAHVLNTDELITIKSRDTFKVGYGINKDSLASISEIKSKYRKKILNIAYLGRLDDQKNILRLLDVIKLMKDNIDIHFYIAGGGKYKELVADLASKIENLTYEGFVPQDKIKDFYLDKHVFIILSKYETFCGAILEALTGGLLVIATKTSGMVKDRPDLIFRTLEFNYKDNELVKTIQEMSAKLIDVPEELEQVALYNTTEVQKLNRNDLTIKLAENLARIYDKEQ